MGHKVTMSSEACFFEPEPKFLQKKTLLDNIFQYDMIPLSVESN